MKRRIISIDPGPKLCAWVSFLTTASQGCPVSGSNTTIEECEIENTASAIRCFSKLDRWTSEMVIELPVTHHGSRAVDSTILAVGRLAQFSISQSGNPELLTRGRIVAHMIGKNEKSDARIIGNIRERIGGFGASMKSVKGSKKEPGPLYGFRGDIWQAFAVGIAFVEGAEVEKEWR